MARGVLDFSGINDFDFLPGTSATDAWAQQKMPDVDVKGLLSLIEAGGLPALQASATDSLPQEAPLPPIRTGNPMLDLAAQAEPREKGKSPQNPDAILSAAARAIQSVESAGSGGYSALGPRVKNGDRAYGAYQVMGNNVGPWTEKHFGQRLTPEEFLANKAAQDAVFQGEFGGYLKKHGSVEDAASMWFTGRPFAKAAAAGATDGYTRVQDYVAKVNKFLGQDDGGERVQTAGGGWAARNTPGGPLSQGRTGMADTANPAGLLELLKQQQPQDNTMGNLMSALGMSMLASKDRRTPIDGAVLASVLSANQQNAQKQQEQHQSKAALAAVLMKSGIAKTPEEAFAFAGSPAGVQMLQHQTDAARAQANTDRSFGLQERQFEITREDKKADNTRADAHLDLARQAANIPKVFGSAENGYYTIEKGVVTPIVPANSAAAPTVKQIKQPDGSEVAVQWDAAQKTWVPLVAPQGGTAVPPTLPKLTEDQSKSIGFYNRAVSAAEEFNPVEFVYASGVGRALDKVPGGVGNYAKEPEFQKAETAAKNWLAPILRKDSGAAITPQEMDQYGTMFLPQPGDHPGTIELKRKMRQEATDGIRAGLGPATVLAKARETAKVVAEVAPEVAPKNALPEGKAPSGFKPLGFDEAVARLKAAPTATNKIYFDQVYGKGAAAKALGG